MKSTVTHRTGTSKHLDEDVENDKITKEITKEQQMSSWKRILLLIIAITVHNIPGMEAVMMLLFKALFESIWFFLRRCLGSQHFFI